MLSTLGFLVLVTNSLLESCKPQIENNLSIYMLIINMLLPNMEIQLTLFVDGEAYVTSCFDGVKFCVSV